MSMFPQSDARRPTMEMTADSRAVVTFFNTVYAWMFAGLALTATVAWLVSQSPQMIQFLNQSPFVVVAMLLGAFGIAMAVQAAAARISVGAAIGLFLLYAGVIGMIISYIFLVYDMSTIGGAFLMTAGVFGAMSVYGFVTKRDLSGIGSILVMGVLGLFAASLVNVFLANNALSWIITYAVLALFIGLVAYHTQQLKAMAYAHRDDPKMSARYAIVGALVLYIAFINMFMAILRIMGSRR